MTEALARSLASAPVARLQGWYYILTGGWALVSMPTFELVTGPKRERWLVRTVALLLCVIGSSLVLSDRRGTLARETTVLGAGTAASLAAIDLIYVLRGTLRPIYLGDAVVEAGFIGRWWRDAVRLRGMRPDTIG